MKKAVARSCEAREKCSSFFSLDSLKIFETQKRGLMMRKNIWLTIFVACAAALIGCQAQESPATDGSGRALSLAPSPSPAQNVVHPKFVITADQARKAFDEYALKGEKQQKVQIGEVQSLKVTAQGPNKPEILTLSVVFMSPLEQARKYGYDFGLVAKNRTPADRKDFEDRMVERIVRQSNQVAFVVRLLPVPNSTINVPQISFGLLDHEGKRISPTKQPADYAAPDNDIIGSVALEENGQELIFPAYGGTEPKITAKMEKMTLVVQIDEQEQKLEYRLK
jgi:hypothetical protein